MEKYKVLIMFQDDKTPELEFTCSSHYLSQHQPVIICENKESHEVIYIPTHTVMTVVARKI